jgi:hypothetical protein
MTTTIIAHRGWWWPDPAKQNSPQALQAALDRGWGVELDVWQGDDPYILQIGHDQHAATPLADDTLDALAVGDGLILWNVKNAGCDAALELLFEGHRRFAARSYIFDFDYQDTDPLIVRRFPEGNYLYRPEATIDMSPGEHDGWWIDVDVTEPPMSAMPRFYVSPELHGRPLDLAKWTEWRMMGAGICTDHPHLLEALERGDAPLSPVDPWWST